MTYCSELACSSISGPHIFVIVVLPCHAPDHLCSVLYIHMTRQQKTEHLARWEIRDEKVTRMTWRPGRRTSPDSRDSTVLASTLTLSMLLQELLSQHMCSFSLLKPLCYLTASRQTQLISTDRYSEQCLCLVQFHWNLGKALPTLMDFPLLLAECRNRQSPALQQ